MARTALEEAQKQFSVLAWNLILVCETCNRRKSNRLYTAPRSILNPYFDPIPETALLQAEIEIAGGRIKLSYRVESDDPGVDPELVALARRHLEALDLSRDLVREGATYISTVVKSIAAEYAAPIESARLKAILDGRMRGLEKFPINSWQAAVIDAMEQCPDLLAFINARIASAPRPARARPIRNLGPLRAAAGALSEAQSS